ncbi:hypothetical protein CLOP_g1344 [Closterium sp. NIES-67]|nr:hypothetical protein CLOP_g1344 [Closterium sp. NIES-67]
MAADNNEDNWATGESVVEPLYWSAVKKIVAGYIQANDLQRGKWITCDDALQALCDTDSTTQAQFYYTLATHYPVKSSVKVPRRLLKRQAEEEAAKMRGGDKEKGKGTRGGGGGEEGGEEEGGGGWMGQGLEFKGGSDARAGDGRRRC